MPFARTTDPETSHEAASTVTNVELTKAAIYYLLRVPMTDSELVKAYSKAVEHGYAPEASESGIRSRRSELVGEGLAKATGERRKTPSGRSSTVWTRLEVEGC